MKAALARILVGVLVAIPAVAVVCVTLLRLPHAVAFPVTMVGLALVLASEHLRWRWAAASGGVLLFGGLLAWALVAAGHV